VLAVWLASLPPDGWEGSIRVLEDALGEAKAERRLRGRIPQGNALGVRFRDELAFLEDHGFAVAFHRTAKARTILLAKAKKTDRKTGRLIR
jgi:hypothetical protein